MDVDDDEPVDAVDPTWLEAALDHLSRPVYPLTSRWGLSIADLLGTRWEVPRGAGKLLRLLDRAGAIRLSPEGVGIDHQDVAWDDLEEIRLVSLFDLLRGDGVGRSADALTRFLPPVPGRRWVLRRVAGLVAALAVRFSSVDRAGWPLVPGELVHRAPFGRTKETDGTLIAALLWSAVPEALHVLEATARDRGIPVTRPAVAVNPPER